MDELLLSSNLLYSKKYKLILESINEIVWEANLFTKGLKIIGEFDNFLCYDNDEITTLMDFTEKIILPEDKERVKYEFGEYLNGNSMSFNMQFRIKTKYGEIKWILVNGKAVNNIRKLWIGSITDITDKKMAEEQVHFMAFHDQLTNLPNKIYFENEFKKLIDIKEDTLIDGAAILIDIDDFHSVNDSFEYSYGDVLLKIIAELLKFCVANYGITARMDGDEFLILVPDIISTAYLKKICKLIISSFRNPFEILDKQTYVTASMGIVVFERKNAQINKILINADIAMHYAKSKGKNKFVIYDKKLENENKKNKIIENNLQKALDNNEFEIYYQPQVDINFNKIRGFEALLRWTSPELGNVPPSEFIPIAEKSGLIYKIGEWVLKNACLQAKKWKDKGYLFDTISVNISPKQIKNNYFSSFINKVLTEINLEPKYLEIEITEGTLIKSIEEKSKLLKKLISQNIKVSIDDFGKGYSSLNYLTVLPINTLKIDKSFIDRICKDSKSLTIVECIIELSKKLNYTVIAEGVESVEQKDLLSRIGCSYIQGYYYSKPLPALMLEDILKDREISYA